MVPIPRRRAGCCAEPRPPRRSPQRWRSMPRRSRHLSRRSLTSSSAPAARGAAAAAAAAAGTSGGAGEPAARVSGRTRAATRAVAVVQASTWVAPATATRRATPAPEASTRTKAVRVAARAVPRANTRIKTTRAAARAALRASTRIKATRPAARAALRANTRIKAPRAAARRAVSAARRAPTSQPRRVVEATAVRARRARQVSTSRATALMAAPCVPWGDTATRTARHRAKLALQARKAREQARARRPTGARLAQLAPTSPLPARITATHAP